MIEEVVGYEIYFVVFLYKYRKRALCLFLSSTRLKYLINVHQE